MFPEEATQDVKDENRAWRAAFQEVDVKKGKGTCKQVCKTKSSVMASKEKEEHLLRDDGGKKGSKTLQDHWAN